MGAWWSKRNAAKQAEANQILDLINVQIDWLKRDIEKIQGNPHMSPALREAINRAMQANIEVQVELVRHYRQEEAKRPQ